MLVWISTALPTLRVPFNRGTSPFSASKLRESEILSAGQRQVYRYYFELFDEDLNGFTEARGPLFRLPTHGPDQSRTCIQITLG